jgi:hypothetical protein
MLLDFGAAGRSSVLKEFDNKLRGEILVKMST